MIGAASSRCVKKYVCFDPNTTLRPGYVQLLKLFSKNVKYITNDYISFDNNFHIYSQPFEIGAKALKDNSFDLIFTSPPFFDYEMYNPNNPEYKNWIDEFYKPLFIESCRVVKEGGHVCIHIGNIIYYSLFEYLLFI